MIGMLNPIRILAGIAHGAIVAGIWWVMGHFMPSHDLTFADVIIATAIGYLAGYRGAESRA